MKFRHIGFSGFLIILSVGAQLIAQNSSTDKFKPSIRIADSLFFAQNWKAAKPIYETILSDTSHNGIAWNRLGFCNYQEGNYDVALKNYQKSLNTKPSSPVLATVWSRIAKIQSIRNEKQSALTALDSAVNNSYSNLGELDTLNDFKNLRNEQKFKHLRAKVYAIAMPCMADKHAREFDFWVGDWDVYQTGTTNLVGHNLIQIIADGCGLLENWTNLGNRTGKSINFIDANNKWKQSWVGGGNQEFVNGEYKEGAMRFTFENTSPQGAKIMGRFIFFNEKPGQVRQFNETSSDGGKTWVTSYDFTYLKK